LVSTIFVSKTKFCNHFSIPNLTLLTAGKKGDTKKNEENKTNRRYRKAKRKTEKKQKEGIK
jgi:hypothetical protein